MFLQRCCRAIVARPSVLPALALVAFSPTLAMASDGGDSSAAYALVSQEPVSESQWLAIAEHTSGAPAEARIHDSGDEEVVSGAASELFPIDIAALVASGVIPSAQADHHLSLTLAGGRVFMLVSADTLEASLVSVSPADGDAGDSVVVIEASASEDWFLTLLASILELIDPEWEPTEPDPTPADPEEDDGGDDVW